MFKLKIALCHQINFRENRMGNPETLVSKLCHCILIINNLNVTCIFYLMIFTIYSFL
jgi:hypothetical protein